MLGQGKILKAQLLCNHAHDEPHVVARPNLVNALEVMHRFLMHAHAHASRPQAASQAAARPAVGLSSCLWPNGGASCRRPAGFVLKRDNAAETRVGKEGGRAGEVRWVRYQ